MQVAGAPESCPKRFGDSPHSPNPFVLYQRTPNALHILFWVTRSVQFDHDLVAALAKRSVGISDGRAHELHSYWSWWLFLACWRLSRRIRTTRHRCSCCCSFFGVHKAAHLFELPLGQRSKVPTNGCLYHLQQPADKKRCRADVR